MVEEYQSIMKNEVWDIVSILDGNSVVTSIWLYKIKHGEYGSLKNTRLNYFPEGSLRKRESIMMRNLILGLDTLPSDRSLLFLQLWDGSCIR